MKVVIDIPEEIMEYIKNNGCLSVIYSDEIAKAIIDSTPLPKGHGKLIDADALKKNYKTGYWDLNKVLDNAKPIIKAEKEDE